MVFVLRDYQVNAVDAAMSAIKKSTASLVLELATGSGKSLVVAEIANQIRALSGKKTLCLAPSKELVTQNFKKYISFGNPASFWSASVGQKSVKHAAVFGTPLSVLNGIDAFKTDFACIVIDECDGISPTVKKIIKEMKAGNPNLRVIGLTATPFRTGSGYIYKVGLDGKPAPSEQASKPYFDRLAYQMQTQELLDKGFLTRPVFSEHADGYQGASQLELNRQGQFDAGQVAEVFEGKGRLTAEIVADVVSKADLRFGVMFFAASINHAHEIAESLPEELSAVVTGSTPKKERESILAAFERSELRYLINVNVLTVGYDSPRVGTIGILRATESPRLLLQIIGRGMRLFDGKEHALILDYAGNLERHGIKQDDLNPTIKASQVKPSSRITALCPECGYPNDFALDGSVKGAPLDANGYIIDAFGHRITGTNGEPLPGHKGQRCQNVLITRNGAERCTHLFAWKNCPECSHANTLTVRHCTACNHELIDPNKKLALKEQAKAKASQWQQSDVLSMRMHKLTNSIKIVFIVPSQDTRRVIVYFIPYKGNQADRPAWQERGLNAFMFSLGMEPGSYIDSINTIAPPKRIQWRKKENGFFDVQVLTL